MIVCHILFLSALLRRKQKHKKVSFSSISFFIKFVIGLECMLGLVNMMTACLLLSGTESTQDEQIPAVPPLNTVHTVDCAHVL